MQYGLLLTSPSLHLAVSRTVWGSGKSEMEGKTRGSCSVGHWPGRQTHDGGPEQHEQETPHKGKGLAREGLQTHCSPHHVVQTNLGKEGKICVVANWMPSLLLD